MTQRRDLRARRTRKDGQTVLIALLVFALMGGAGWWMSRSLRKQQEEVLATVPAFPSKEDPPKERRRPPDPIAVSAPPPVTPTPSASPVPRPPDALTRFAMQPSKSVALVEVNAIVNTPFFERLQECYPIPEDSPDRQPPFDWRRDVDRVAMTDHGMIMSGFFDDKLVASWMTNRNGHATQREYRGFVIFDLGAQSSAQRGSIVMTGPANEMNAMIDRVLDPAPADAATADVYGDVYFRSDMQGFRTELGENAQEGQNRVLDSIFERLDGVTLRANVWDSVALTLDGAPRNGQSIEGLASVIRGALSVAKNQIDSDDVRLSVLSELAKVDTDDKGIKLNLAVPVADLFDKFHFPCPAKDPKPPEEVTKDVPEEEPQPEDVPETAEAAEEP